MADKATKTAGALRQLRGELISEGQHNQARAISDYLTSCSNDSLTRLFDILTKKAQTP